MLKIDTKREMYNYILSDREKSIKGVDSNFQVYVTDFITSLSKKLFKRTELYIGKVQITKDKNYKLVRNKNYKCKSNKLIYDTLHQIGIGYDYKDNNNNQIIKKQLVELDYDDYENIEETGSSERRKLIRACKIYNRHQDFKIYKKDEYESKYCIAEDSFLCEQTLGKYTVDIFGGKKQSHLDTDKILRPYVRRLEPDMLIWDNTTIYVLDSKVYKEIIKNKKYIHNGNLFQVNSYIGKCLDTKYSNKNRGVGVLVHIADNELYEKSKEADNADLSIESDRLIKLWIIEDKGLDYILEEYDRRVKELMNNT